MALKTPDWGSMRVMGMLQQSSWSHRAVAKRIIAEESRRSGRPGEMMIIPAKTTSGHLLTGPADLGDRPDKVGVRNERRFMAPSIVCLLNFRQEAGARYFYDVLLSAQTKIAIGAA